ncbi:MAG: hypothetical protein ACK46S_09655 [Bacteroidota bacterium]
MFRGTWYLAAPAFAAIVVLVGRDANHGNTRTIGWQGCQPWTNWLAGMPKIINLQAYPKGIYVARVNGTQVCRLVKE